MYSPGVSMVLAPYVTIWGPSGFSLYMIDAIGKPGFSGPGIADKHIFLFHVFVIWQGVNPSILPNTLLISTNAVSTLETSPVITRAPVKRSKNPIFTEAAFVANVRGNDRRLTWR